MAITHSRPKRKATGARYVAYRKKRKHELGRLPALTKVGEKSVKSIRTRGHNIKLRALAINKANLFNPKTKKFEQVKITNIIDNPANRHFVRRGIITKGTVIDTEKGKAKVTSRPGQSGTVDAVLV